MREPIVPRAFDPTSVPDWINVLHHAAAIPKGSPDYEDAQSAVQQALTHIGHLNRQANAADPDSAEPGKTNVVASAVLPFMHEAYLGLGEPIAGAISAASGKGFRQGAANYRAGEQRLEVSHPKIAGTARVLGTAVPMLLPGGQAIEGVAAGRAMEIPQVLGRIGKGAAIGAGFSGASAFAEGGEDPGDMATRLALGAEGAKTGAKFGAVLTALGLAGGPLSARGRTRQSNARAAEARAQWIEGRLAARRPPPNWQMGAEIDPNVDYSSGYSPPMRTSAGNQPLRVHHHDGPPPGHFAGESRGVLPASLGACTGGRHG